MISMSQTQIALYLQDYFELISLMSTYPDAQPYFLFEMYLTKEKRQEQATNEYYQRMINVAYIFTKMKIFSIAEDYTLKQQNNFINNNDLDLSFLDDKITGNRASISNKKLLQMLRDGFNHTCKANELYKISVNGKYIKFHFQKPTSITIKLSSEDVTSLINSISDTSQTFHFFSFNKPVASTIKEYVENLHLTRHYFPKKVNKENMISVFTSQAENNHEDAIKKVKSIEKVTEKEIPLSKHQQENILRNIESLIPNIITLEEFKENIEYLTLILLNKELPIPILKLDNYLLDSFVIGQLLPHKVFSYNQMYTIFTEGLKIDTPNPINKYKYIFNKYKELLFKTYFPNKTEKETYASLLFAEYIVSNFKPENDFIEIEDIKVEYRKLRNSLVHGRWHLDEDNIIFYDAKPNVESETDYNWTITLNSKSLINYCKTILKNRLEKEKPKQKQKTILDAKNKQI